MLYLRLPENDMMGVENFIIQRIYEEEELPSFLFTSIPVKLAIECVKNQSPLQPNLKSVIKDL